MIGRARFEVDRCDADELPTPFAQLVELDVVRRIQAVVLRPDVDNLVLPTRLLHADLPPKSPIVTEALYHRDHEERLVNGPDQEPRGGGPVQLSIVIPAFNEARRLPGSLQAAMAALDGDDRWLPAEVIIVDDGSTDGTAASARKVPVPPRVVLRIARYEENRGKGAAVRTGFSMTRGRLVLLSDADLATPIEELDRLAEVAAPGVVVIGSRAVDRTLISVRQPWYRDFMGRTFNVLVRHLLLSGIHDTQCGFKLFPGDAARSLAAAQRLDGFAFDVELLLLARLWGLRIDEVAVRWRHVEASRVSPARHSFEMFRDILRLTWWKRRGLLPARPPSLAEARDLQS